MLAAPHPSPTSSLLPPPAAAPPPAAPAELPPAAAVPLASSAVPGISADPYLSAPAEPAAFLAVYLLGIALLALSLGHLWMGAAAWLLSWPLAVPSALRMARRCRLARGWALVYLPLFPWTNRCLRRLARQRRRRARLAGLSSA